jgi:hypothetical protein
VEKVVGRTHTYEKAVKRLREVAQRDEQASSVLKREVWTITSDNVGNKTFGVFDYLEKEHSFLIRRQP